jgi:hypothetical protein
VKDRPCAFGGGRTACGWNGEEECLPLAAIKPPEGAKVMEKGCEWTKKVEGEKMMLKLN